MIKEPQKTHWLQNPNKNYLGHQDLPNGKNLKLTIASAQWEEVKDQRTQSSSSKRVVRFKEENIKPFICNEVNAKAISKSTNEKFMENSIGKIIELTISKTKVAGEIVDCIRISTDAQFELDDTPISKEQEEIIANLLVETKKDSIEFCKSLQIETISSLPARRFTSIENRLNEIKEEQNEAI